MSKKFGAIVLAAGFSSRMGAFKPLLPLGDKTVIECILDEIQSSGINQTIVVTGHNREALLPVIDLYKVTEAFNSRFEEGMFTSTQAGVAALPEGLDGFFIMPVDCPLVKSEVMEMLMNSFDQNKFSVAVYRGKKGHPLLIPEKFRREIIEHDGKNGLKDITDRDFGLMQRIETDFEGVVMDMDTPEAYEELKEYMENGCLTESLDDLAKGRRFLLIRHGQIKQHKEKIFLGQTDVPLSDEGRAQAIFAADEVESLKINTDRIYTSDLLRASQTAKIIQLGADIPELVTDENFREMNLGPWDGKFISEIKETMPEEYEKRGKNLMIYKMGHGSENFYDLQYRVINALKKILKNDDNKDIIITAHSGVLRVIENNLQGGDVADEWEKMKNGEVRVIEK